MIKISDLKHSFQAIELLSSDELLSVKGGQNRDDKRRQRPGGGTTTTSPNLRDGSSRHNRKCFAVYENCDQDSAHYDEH